MIREALRNWLLKSGDGDLPQEGEYRDGPWLVTSPDGTLPNAWGKFWNYWQMGRDPLELDARSAVVEACVSAYAETVSMCPATHWRALSNGGRERVTNSALSRLIKFPNDYQSFSEFVYNQVRALYETGNTYAMADRNDRFEVSALHPFDSHQSKPVVGKNRAIFYELAGNNIIEGGNYWGPSWPFTASDGNAKRLVPARDCLHMKLEAKPDEPLVGIPPARHAPIALATQSAIGSQLINFFKNMSRPSGVLSTDLTLTKQQVEELRQRWNEQSRGMNAGGTPILTAGLKYNGVAVSAKDADLINALKLTQDEIFMVFGVPPAILGMTDRAGFASTEALMQFWLARGLGFAINLIEGAIDQFFGLKGWPDEYIEFDTKALLRVSYRDRIEALARGVQGGIFAPNEARNEEDLPDAPYGDEPRVQQQVVPLSAWAKTASQPATPAAPAAPAADVSGKPAEEEQPEEAEKLQLIEITISAFSEGALCR